MIRERPIRGESQRDFLGESEGSLPPPQDSLLDAREAMNDFWSMSRNFKNRHHVEPRVKLYSPREESFPIPLKYIDVTRTTDTSLDVMLEKKHRSLSERRWRSRIVRYVDRFHKIHCIERKSTGWIYMVRRETDKKTNDIQARHFVARDLERYVQCVETQTKAKVGDRETKARQCQKIAWYLLH